MVALATFCAGTLVQSDFNSYGSPKNDEILGLVPVTAPRSTPTLYSLSRWRATTGMDAHSQTAMVGFANAADRSPNGSQLRTASTALSAGRAGGNASGVAIAIGAWGGDARRSAAISAQLRNRSR